MKKKQLLLQENHVYYNSEIDKVLVYEHIFCNFYMFSYRENVGDKDFGYLSYDHKTLGDLYDRDGIHYVGPIE